MKNINIIDLNIEEKAGEDMSGYLKNIIKESKISELTIAQKLNIDVSTLRLWEEGAYPQKIEHLKQLAEILNTTTDLIVFSHNRREPLKISKLTPKQREIVYQLYLLLKK